MKKKVSWYLLKNEDQTFTIGNDLGARMECRSIAHTRRAMKMLVDNTTDMFYALFEHGVDTIKFTVEY